MKLRQTWDLAAQAQAVTTKNSPDPDAQMQRVRASGAGHLVSTSDVGKVASRLVVVSRLEEELARRRRWLVAVMSKEGERRQEPSLEEHVSALNQIEEELADQRRKLETALQHVRTVAASHSNVQTGTGEGTCCQNGREDAKKDGQDGMKEIPTVASLLPAHKTVRASAHMQYLDAL